MNGESKRLQSIEKDEFYLNLCLQNAWQNQILTLPNPSVSALVLDKYGAIISLESHQECGKPHAEVLALQKAYVNLSGDDAILLLKDSAQIHNYLIQHSKNLFRDSTIYVSLEPCSSLKCGETPSCATLLKTIKIKRVVIAAQDIHKQAKGGAEELEQCGISVTKAWKSKNLTSINHKANHLLLPFKSLQTKERFILYKYACRLDGSINGGQISSKAAQEQIHNYRTRANSLLISGKTIRIDKPILDTRFATLNSKDTPNVTILTNDKNFPRVAPLFNVSNREVKIVHNVDSLLHDAKGFIICEGGAGLFETLQPHIDMLLIILNPSINTKFSLSMRLNQSFHFAHSMQVGEDLFLWLLPKQI